MFNTSKATHNGVIYRNFEAQEGKYVTNLLPITKSTYLVLGFSTTEDWKQSNSTVLLRTNYLDTTSQFEYTIPNAEKNVTCFRLLYIEYSNYFVASFSKNNGVLLYDLTQPSKAPNKLLKPDGHNYRHLSYLEASKVLLTAAHYTKKIYGYSMTGKTVYQLSTKLSIAGLRSFKSSNFFVIFSGIKSKYLYFYNLNGMVYRTKFEEEVYMGGLIHSEHLGSLILLQENVLIRYSWSEETSNPACSSKAYSFTNRWCDDNCSPEAVFTERGVCELYQDPDFLVFFNKELPKNLPKNLVGEVLHLRDYDDVDYVPPQNGKNGFDWKRDFEQIAKIVGIFVFIVVCLIIPGVIIYICRMIRDNTLESSSQIRRKEEPSPSTQPFKPQVPLPKPMEDNRPESPKAEGNRGKDWLSDDQSSSNNQLPPLSHNKVLKIDKVEKESIYLNELTEIEKLKLKNEALEKENEDMKKEKEAMRKEREAMQWRMTTMERDFDRKKKLIDEEKKALGIMKGGIHEAIPVQPINQYSIQIQESGGNGEIEIKDIDVVRDNSRHLFEP